MKYSVFNRQSSSSTINTPTKDDVFDFSKSFSDASNADCKNTPCLMTDQSSYDFNPNTNNVPENLPDVSQISSGTFSKAYNENDQGNGVEEEHTSTAMQVDDGSRTWGYDDSNSVKETVIIKQYLNEIEYDPSKTVHFLKEIVIFDEEIPSETESSSCNLTNQGLQSLTKEKDTVTENQFKDRSIILPDDSHSNKKVFLKSRKNTTKNQDCKSDRLFKIARLHNPPKKIVPFGSKLTLFGSKEYIECMIAGKKICQKNQAIIDEAMGNGNVVRSNNGRNLTIFGSDKYAVRKELNLIHTHKFREDQK
jgi:hypothetical protein